ncbi:MAG: redoxin domain-containing protein [Xanthobacteraceae bacterium]
MDSRPVSPGEPAPDFVLPAIDGTGTVALADYKGRNPVFLALFIGLWCPFCRRAIAHVSSIEGQLKAVGVEALGVVATEPENARVYFKFRPTQLRLASDPELKTHRAYRLPVAIPSPEFTTALETIRINPSGELPEPLPVREAINTLARMDKYAITQTDRADMEQQTAQRSGLQFKGQFLIDRHGIVRWANIECANEGLPGLGKIPTTEEILDAVRTMQHG